MIIENTEFEGRHISKLDKKKDNRGYFARFYCFEEFKNLGLLNNIAQANISDNPKKLTFRGMHYQVSPYQETKIVTCLKGAIIDFVIDLRKEKPTFMKSFQLELNEENQFTLVIPKGFAHGYLTLKKDTRVFYLVDEPFSPESENGLRWDDPSFDLKLPEAPRVISEKDASWKDYL